MSCVSMSYRLLITSYQFKTLAVCKLVIVLLLVIGHWSFLPAQTVSQLIKAGDKKFTEGEHYSASLYYKDALKKDDENIELNFKYAEACRLFSDLTGAELGYSNVVKLDKSNQYPLALFWLGEVTRSNCECKCPDAQKLFHRFQTKYRKRDYYYAKAQQEIESCAWVKDHLKKNDSVNVEHLGKEINTPQSEFNAIHVFPDRLQYSALRNISNDKKNEKYLVRIYNQPPNPEPFFIPNGANTNMNIGNGAYSPDSKKFFFTQCEQKDKSTTRCDIYVTRYENYKWTAAEKLTDHVNDPKATNTHPSVGYDLSGNEVLFFCSDREGGQGNMDIWFSKLNNDGTYSQAVNPGSKLNTPGNEITPFFDVHSHTLFFSSDWHYGFGGYDIFETRGESVNWSEPKNLMQPVNTSQNDLYYTMAADNSRAYITSNRKGSYFIEAETCCNDIYAYNTGKKIEKRDTTVRVKIDTPVVAVSMDTFSAVKIEPKVLIQEKLARLKQVMPRLYFHNDEPDAKTLSDTTKLDYKETYEAYSALRNEYMREYLKSLKREERENGEKEITDLFSNKVDRGFYDLIAFSSQMLDMLQKGNKLEITIKGFCSPLNYNEYNIRLGYRRVASLRNYFFHYRDGIFLPFIASGNLILKTESFGEETAPAGISDDRNDKSNSVYNPKAAFERRVEIISVELK